MTRVKTAATSAASLDPERAAAPRPLKDEAALYRAAARRLRTVRDLLRFGVSRCLAAGVFLGHGYAEAWDEVAHLLRHALHLPPGPLEPYLEARLVGPEIDAALDLIRRRVGERVPAAYLTGSAWLGDFRFTVDARVIVPRSFIAELLFEGLAPWIDDPARITRVLDLCTGSGCLAIIAAAVFPNARVDAVDLSDAALAVARANVADYQLEERLRLVASDLYTGLPKEADGKPARYDLILSNPPYVTDAAMATLPAEYRHEPRLALAGGSDGLDLVRRILAGAQRRLAAAGLLVVEVGHERAHLEAAFPGLPCTWLATAGGDDMVFLLERRQLGQLAASARPAR